MKILKLLSKKYLSIIIILVIPSISVLAEEKPVDIWKVDKEKKEKNQEINASESESDNDDLSVTDIYKMQSQKEIDLIKQIETIDSDEIKLIGLYDPEDYGLDVNMWSNSNGDQLKSIFIKLAKMDLSNDASEILKISLLTNAHPPKKNISEKEFNKFKSNLLIKNSDLLLIEEYLIKNQIINSHPLLSRYLVDLYLSEANIEKACKIFKKILNR